MSPILIGDENKVKEDREEQFRKFYQHKKLFNIKDNNFLRLFEDLMKKSDDFFLECSCKVKNNKIFPSRFIICYNKECVKNINLSFNFFRRLEENNAKINYSLIKKIIDNDIELGKIEQVMIGIDLRENHKKSRLKFWMVINRKYYKLFNRIIELHGYNDRISGLINKNELLFGFDFYFDGRTNIKIYPHFFDYEFKNKIILKNLNMQFSTKIIKLISICNYFCVNFKGKNYDRIISFLPNNTSFFYKLNLKELDRLVNLTKPEDYSMVTLKEKEINSNKIKSFNFYY